MNDADRNSAGARADRLLGRALLRAIALIPGAIGLAVVLWSLLALARGGGPGAWIDLAVGIGLLLAARWFWRMKRPLSDLLDE